MLVLVIVGALVGACVISAVLLHRRERRDREEAERLAFAARLRNGPRVRSYDAPAAKGIQSRGGKDAA